MSEATHILRIECPDEKGLVYKVTEVLYKRGLNIVNNAEFVDHANHLFFMRTEFSGAADSKAILKTLRGRLPAGAAVEIARGRKKEIVLLASREPHCVGDLLLRHAHGELPANILAVVSNHSDLQSLVGRFKVPFHFIRANGPERAEHEAAIQKVLSRYRPEYLVLAKYMRILSESFVSRYKNRVINIHHSFLPAFVGANPYRQASDRGVKIIGATAHYVNEELDMGPIIAQGTIAVDHSHSAVDMAQAGRDVEKMVLAKALKLAFEDRIFVSGNKTIIFD